MPRSTIDPSSSRNRSTRLSRRELLAGAGAGAAALVLEPAASAADAATRDHHRLYAHHRRQCRC